MKLKIIFPDLGHFPLVYRRTLPVLAPAVLAALTPPDIEISFTDERLGPVTVEEDCDLVAISVMTPQAGRAYELSRLYRKRGIPVVLGGVHISLLPQEAEGRADAIVIGEAEESWPRLLEDFQRGSLQKVYRCLTPPAEIPFPRWDLFDRDPYLPVLPVQVARGCPVNCDLCSVPQTFGREFRPLNLDQFWPRLAQLNRYLFLVNDNLHLAKRRSGPLLETLSGIGREWVGLASLSMARDASYLKLLQKSHCWAMYLELSPWVSAGLNEVIDGVEVRRAGEYLQRVRDQGIKVIASFVFGFDHDQKDIFERTVAFALEHRIEEAEFHILTPYPNSRLYQRIESEGRLLSRDFSEYTAGSVVFQPRNMTPEALYQGYLQAWRDFYRGSEIRETAEGPVVLTYNCFPISLDEIRRVKGIDWLDTVIAARYSGG
ncbi:MAG: cobalamin B12-binding domain-containing protein [Deltaproteobacteria bacterium]|nr:cobalamin B12-binding domain-containing protein [Deltaproteobacteria bacterium]